MDTFLLRCGVGPLLYCPAVHAEAANSIIKEKFGRDFSFALCLEDTIGESHVGAAENTLISILHTLMENRNRQEFYIPKLFIRVRKPEQISLLYRRLEASKPLLTGFIAPKFSLDNADLYLEQILSINSVSAHTVYLMPILESPSMINLQCRHEILYHLKDRLDKISGLILNLRIGGNDLCHMFGFRRQSTESIYDIMPIANILSDIITVFGPDYIISSPVWEYYNGSGWDTGLKKELSKDRLNGFVGKTVIHPNQIPFVNKAFMVSRVDYDDALSILHWENGSGLLVSGNSAKHRMNEYNTHCNWAKKIVALSQAYGILED